MSRFIRSTASLISNATIRSVSSSSAASSSAAAASAASATPAKLPDLPYDFGDLSPVISAQIMQLHHGKHHQAYVNNYNTAIQQYAEAHAKNDTSQMIHLQPAIRFNGGGHINHSIFWTNLSPVSKHGGAPPSGDLAAAIDKTFGSLDKFITNFNTQAAAIQGSGWGWLVYNKTSGGLQIVTLQNQDPVTGHLVPLLGVDVWEHAYYLDYKNVRPDYLKNIWKVVNWTNVAERFTAAKGGK